MYAGADASALGEGGIEVAHTWTKNRINLMGWLENDPIERRSEGSGNVAAVFWLVTETASGVQERHEVSAHKNQATQVLRGCRKGSRVDVEGKLREGRVMALTVKFLDGPA